MDDVKDGMSEKLSVSLFLFSTDFTIPLNINMTIIKVRMTYTDEQVFTLVQSALFNLREVQKLDVINDYSDVKLRIGIATDLLQSIIINMRSVK